MKNFTRDLKIASIWILKFVVWPMVFMVMFVEGFGLYTAYRIKSNEEADNLIQMQYQIKAENAPMRFPMETHNEGYNLLLHNHY